MNGLSSLSSLPLTWQMTALSLGMAVVLACGLSLLAAWLLRHRSAPVRYGLLLSAVVLCLAAPGLSQLGRLSGVGQVRVVPPPALSTPPAAVTPVDAPQTFLPADLPQTVATPSPAPKPRFVFSWAMVGGGLMALWALGILAGLARLALGATMVWMLIRSSRPADSAALPAAAERARQALGLRTAPRLRESPMTPMPLVVGLFRPVILLPSGLAERLEAEQLDAVLLHETAHVAHRDPLIGFAQRLAGALFWWCPLLHQVNHRLNELREYICDNYVIRTQGDGFRLARVLVEMAEQAQSGRWLRLAGAMAVTEPGGSRLEARVRRLLRGDCNTVTRMNLAALCATAAFSLLVGCAMVGTAVRTDEEQQPGASEEPKIRVTKVSTSEYTVATSMNMAKLTLLPGKWGTMTISSQDHIQWVFEAMVKSLDDEDVELSYRLSLAKTKGICEWQEHERRVSLGQWVKMQAETAGPFEGVKEIVVRLGAPTPQQQQQDGACIASAKINELLATIKVEMPKKPCACMHQDSAVFLKDKGRIKVLFCEHCFDFDGKFYAMPAEFYAFFRKASAANQATVVLRVRPEGGLGQTTTAQYVGGKQTATGTTVRILEVIKNKGPEKLAKDGGIEILWDPGDKGLPAAECTVCLEPYRGENWKEGLYSYRLVGADTPFPDYEIPAWSTNQPLPEAEAAALTKAEERYAAKAYAEALTQYDTFGPQFPKSAATSFVIVRKGRCLQLMGRNLEAIKTYGEVLDFFPNEVAQAASALLYTAQCLYRSGDAKEAVKALVELSQDKDYAKHPAATAGRLLLESIQGSKGADSENSDKATKTKVPAAAADGAESIFRQANELLKEKRYAEAAALFEQAQQRFPYHPMAPKALVIVAQCLMRLEDWKGAIRIFSGFDAAYPKRVEDWTGATNQPAIQVARTYTEAEKARPEVRYWLGDCYVKLQDQQQAYWTWESLTSDYPETQWAKYARGRLMDKFQAFKGEDAAVEGTNAVPRAPSKPDDSASTRDAAPVPAVREDRTVASKASQPGETDADALLREARELQETADWAKRLNRPAIPLADLLAACRKVTERYPNTAAARKAMLDVADLQWKWGDKEQAAKSYQELAEKLANTPEGSTAFANVIDARMEKGAVAEALTMIEKYVADPKAPGRDAMLVKGVVAAYRVEDYAKSRTMAEQLIKDHPESEYARKASQELPKIYAKLGLPADTQPPKPAPRKDSPAPTISFYKPDVQDFAPPAGPTATEELAAAKDLLAKGDLVQAARRLDRIVNAKADPQIAAEALWRMAEIYRSCGNMEQAYRAYKILRWDYPGSGWAAKVPNRLVEKEFRDPEKRSNAE
jgi:beta-lactamase regulating signal transducer with metallopeptidase domain/outer membrane protein assembly factor BamD (BamD/ComL family)